VAGMSRLLCFSLVGQCASPQDEPASQVPGDWHQGHARYQVEGAGPEPPGLSTSVAERTITRSG
jgi:hypothetical protein